jgi:hypothetical protein
MSCKGAHLGGDAVLLVLVLETLKASRAKPFSTNLFPLKAPPGEQQHEDDKVRGVEG